MLRYKPIKLAYNLYEAVGGHPKTTPIILMHDILANRKDWHNFPKLLAILTKRKVYTYDARNHGESEHTMESSFEYNVDDLFHFMDKIKAYQSVLIGYKMGGMTAAKAALQKPNRIETLFLWDTPYLYFTQQEISEHYKSLKFIAELIQSFDYGSAKLDLSVVRYPAPDLKFLEVPSLYASIILFRCSALMDAFRLLETDQRIPITGQFNGSTFLLFEHLYFTLKELYVNGIMQHIYDYFPNAIIKGYEGSDQKFNAHVNLAKFIASKIIPA